MMWAGESGGRVSNGWASRTVLVTGGASFIGWTLVEALLDRAARVRVADDLSSGLVSNIAKPLESGDVEFVRGDLRDPDFAHRAMQGVDTCFHLAADHGGRGYVDLHQYAC